MTRCRILATLIALAVLLMVPAIARASDNDIPGTPITLGNAVVGTVDSTTDPNDVYAVTLTEGQEIEMTCTVHGNSTACRVSLLAPSSTSISDEKFYARVADESSGYYEDEPAHFYYTPAVSGVYFVWVTTTDGDGNAPYTLTLGGNAIRPSVYDSVAPTTSAKKVTVQRGAKAVLKFQVNDPEPTCGTANVVVKVRKGSTVLRSVSLNSKPTNQALTWSFRCTLLKGKYTYQVYATDLAGHVQKKAGKAKLVVKK
jgi:hypothetical protein